MRSAAALLLALVALVGLGACGNGDEEGAGGGGSAPAGSEKQVQGADGKQPTGSGEAEAAGEIDEAVVETIVVRDGEPVGGVRELEYSAGSPVRFRVRSDVADEVHVHGYELMEEVGPGGTASFSFPADIEGIFEVELEGLQVQVAELRINP